MVSEGEYKDAHSDDYFIFRVKVSEDNKNELDKLRRQGLTYDRSFKIDDELLIQGTKAWETSQPDLEAKPVTNVSRWIDDNFRQGDSRKFRCLTPSETFNRIREINQKHKDDTEIVEATTPTLELTKGKYPIPSFLPIGLRIGKGIANGDERDRPALLLLGGTHGDEFATPLAVLNFVEFLLGDHSKHRCEGIAQILEKNEVIAFPLINPGGLQYSIDSRTSHRKNANAEYSENTDGSFGVDINRNFPIYFGHAGSSFNPDTYTFPGPVPFSEVESANVDDIIQNHKNVVVVVDTHSGHDQFVYHPGNQTTVRSRRGRKTYKRDVSPLYELLYKVMDDDMKSALDGLNHNYCIGISDDFAGTSDEYFYHGVGVLGFSIEIDESKTPQIGPCYQNCILEYFNRLIISMLSSINKYSIDKYVQRAKTQKYVYDF